MAKTGRILKVAAAVATALVVLTVGGFVVWTRVAGYAAFPEAARVAAQARTARGWYVFEPADPTGVGLVFYPGGLVDPAAYAPLMRRISQRGLTVVVPPMPLDLAVFGSGAASDVIAAYPGVERWIVGGHSLGGSMAAEFVKGHPDAVEGLLFLGSYSAESTDLSKSGVKVLSIHGSRDGVAGDVFEASMRRLPPDAERIEIPGGNHAQFGDYGPQRGDGEATITRETQQELTADAVAGLAARLR